MNVAGGVVTGVASLTASGAVTAGSFTDGTASLTGGALSAVTTIGMSGDLTSAGDISLSKAAAAITHTGATSLTISSTAGW